MWTYKKLTIILVPIIVLLIAAMIGLMVIPDGSGNDVYLQEIQLAQKAAASGDYQNAVIYYKKAIEKDKTQEDAYIQLAKLYKDNLNDLESAIRILQTGVENTNSDLVKNTLAIYLNVETTNLAKTDESKKGKINSLTIRIFSTYTYSDYNNKCTLSSEQKSQGFYSAKYSQFDAEFTYKNSNEVKVIDSNSGIPFDFAKPTLISINDLSTIINGIESGITIDEFKEAGAVEVKQKYDKTLEKNLLVFKYSNCIFRLEASQDGIVKGKNIYNEIIPPVALVNANKTKVFGKVVDVTTGYNVNNAQVKFRKGSNQHSGEIIASYQSTDGKYSVNVAPGDYTAEISASGYIKEYFNVSVNNSGIDQEENFSISPILGAGIRIVLEWGDMPRDLDSHLTGRAYDGTNVDISYQHKSVSNSSGVIAELDVDDRDSYGPETITLNDTQGEYEYKVHKYSSDGSIQSSGATIKVYTNNSSSPMIITVPGNQSGDWWSVFKIKNGQIIDINGVVS